MKVSLKEVIGRETFVIENDSELHSFLKQKRILISGAGGSIGKAIVLELHKLGISNFYASDRDENALHSLQLMIGGAALFNDERIRLCDIRDFKSCENLLSTLKPDIVIHAAALKHLSALEYQEREALLTNVIGTANLVLAANHSGVSQFVNVSTDKAASPKSILGISKRIAEWLVQDFFLGNQSVSVRFGNVFASHGSVIETFQYQLENGLPVTITDLEVERFFMSEEEAAFLVLKAASIQEKGLFVLDMGESVKIKDVISGLARVMGVQPSVTVSGLRPGEKIKEILVSDNEHLTDTKFTQIKKIGTEGDGAGSVFFGSNSKLNSNDISLVSMLKHLSEISDHAEARTFFESLSIT